MTVIYINKQGSLCLLQKAKLLTSRDQSFLGDARLQARALTLNNLGCLMKKWGKVHEGVKFLARAIRIEGEVPGGADNPAGTHVNMSAALSTLGLHRAAAVHAGHAIDLASQAIMGQAAGSLVPSGEDSVTAGGGYVGAAGPGLVEEGGSTSVDATIADDAVGSSCSTRGNDCRTAVIGGAPESSSDAPPLLRGPADGGTIDSAAADNGRSSATFSSSPPSTQDANLGIPDQEKKGVRIRAPTNSAADDRRISPGSVNTSVTEDTSSLERREVLAAAAGGLLAIAHFNLGVEREHLGQLEAALSSYEDARVAADQHLGPESPVAKGIGVALEKASAAAVATASYSSKRAAWRSRSAVSSFPSIGKLQFGQRTPDGVSSFGGRRVSPRRLRHEQQYGEETARDLLDRAYSCARPCPAPPRTDSWSRLGRTLSPRSPQTAPGLESVGGPQRAGRWMTSDAPAARPMRTQGSAARGEGPSRPCSVDEDLRWRALACKKWQCSPREALHAQQAANRRVDVGVAALAGIGDHTDD